MALIVVTGVGGIDDLGADPPAGLGYASIDSTWRIAYPDGADCTLWGWLGVYPDVSGRYVYFNLFDLPRPEVYFIFSGAHLTGAAGGIGPEQFGDAVVVPTLQAIAAGEEYLAFGRHRVYDAALNDIYFNLVDLPQERSPYQLVWGAGLVPVYGFDATLFGATVVHTRTYVYPDGVYVDAVIPVPLVRRHGPLRFNFLEC